MKTNRNELIAQLRSALHELEKPQEDDVAFDILDITDFCFEQSFLDESAGDE